MDRTGGAHMLDFKAFTAVTTIGDLLLRTAAVYPEKDAIVFPDRRLTFTELQENTLRRARGLYALGVRPGDHVGILLPSSLETVECFFAIALLGAVSVPINARYRGRTRLRGGKRRHQGHRHTGPRDRRAGFRRPPERGDPRPERAARERRPRPAEHARAQAPDPDRVRRNPGFTTDAAFREIAETVPAETIDALRNRVRVRDTALMLYTSGTTSHPKGLHDFARKPDPHRAGDGETL